MRRIDVLPDDVLLEIRVYGLEAKGRLRHGNFWFMFVDDGEDLFLDHHVA